MAITDNVIAYWKLDELSGNRLDTVGTRHLVPSGLSGYSPGLLGNALDFSLLTTPGFLTCTNDAIDTTLGLTVWGWIKLGQTERTALLNCGNSGNWNLAYNDDNNWRMYVVDTVTGSSSATVNATMTLNTWYFLCGRWNPSTKRPEVRVNASAWATGTALTNALKSDSTLLYVNRISNDNRRAAFDSIGLANRYMSDAEIDIIYNDGDGIEYPFDGSVAGIEPTAVYTGPTWYISGAST